MTSEVYDLLIVGSGAAGLSAGLYAGRYKMKTLIIGEEFGGETAVAGTIWNYPGSQGIDGYELMKIIKKQAENVGAKVMNGKVADIKNENGCFEVLVEEKKINAKTILLATGAKYRRLGLANEDKFTGNGVHFCVTCDGPVYTDKVVAVVGGGDSAVKGVNELAKYAKKIYLLVRSDKFKAEPINQDEMKKLPEGKVEILFNTEVKEIISEGDKFAGVSLSRDINGNSRLDIDGIFVAIGAVPNTGLAKNLGVNLNQQGYVKVTDTMKTNIEGVYAAGDIVDFFGGFKQDITAAAAGAVAATSAYNYYKVNGNLCKVHWVPSN